MSIKGGIVWEGLNAFRDHVTRTIPEAIRESADAACDRAGDKGVDYMFMFVPVLTGLLQSTCRKLRMLAPSGFWQFVLAAGSPTVDYAAYPEYGTVNQRPQPYLRPALRKASRLIPGFFWEELSKRVETE